MRTRMVRYMQLTWWRCSPVLVTNLPSLRQGNSCRRLIRVKKDSLIIKVRRIFYFYHTRLQLGFWIQAELWWEPEWVIKSVLTNLPPTTHHPPGSSVYLLQLRFWFLDYVCPHLLCLSRCVEAHWCWGAGWVGGRLVKSDFRSHSGSHQSPAWIQNPSWSRVWQ